MCARKQRVAPSKFAMVLDVVVGVGLGLVLAMAWLVFKPVAIADGPVMRAEGQPPPGPHDVTYQMGPQGGIRVSEWATKQRSFVLKSERGVELSDRDVNKWLSETFGPQERKFEMPSLSSSLNLGVPLIRFEGTEAELGVVSDLVVFGSKRRFIMQARGSFKKQGDRFEFVPSKVYLGSCRFPTFLGGGTIFAKVSSLFEVPEEARNVEAAWDAAKDIALAEVSSQTSSETHMNVGF